jgi:NAD(P)-dependent dehydrogenase (short-subunit alcohol dehydrogenase family)
VDTDPAALRRVLDVNLVGYFLVLREAARLFRRQGTGGNVIVNSSKNVFGPGADFGAYSASKAGAHQLGKIAALELAPLGVRVNAVNPGVTVTNLHRRSGMDEPQYAAFLERAKTTHPLGRPGHPDDVAETILFLASDRASWMTGETIPIDGGRHLTCAR